MKTLHPYHYAELAHAAYPQEGEGNQAWSKSLLCRASEHQVEDAQALLAENAEAYTGVCGDYFVVSIRGTETSRALDVIHDIASLDLIDGPFEKGQIGRGFYQHVCQIYERLRDRCRAARKDKLKIVLTGHSLGGAACYIVAAKLVQDGVGLTGVVTFGSPRPGDALFGAHLESRFKLMKTDHQRWVNCNDPVPHVPPARLGFSHVGKPYYLPGAANSMFGEYRKPEQYGTGWSQWFDQLYWTMAGFPWMASNAMKRHHMAEYIRNTMPVDL